MEDGEYFNDVIIDFSIKRLLLDETSPDFNSSKSNKIHAFSSLFYSNLTQRTGHSAKQNGINYEAVSRWAKNVDLFNKDFLYIPVNQGIHWSLFIVIRPYLLVN